MSLEGYISAMRPRMEELVARGRQSRIADDIATRIVHAYAYYNDLEEHSPLQTPEVFWDNASPKNLVYMELYDENGEPVHEAENSEPQVMRHLVKRADFIFGPDDTIFGRVFSVSLNSITEAPYVLGLEDERLEAPEIEQVVIDLTRYEHALDSRLRQQ